MTENKKHERNIEEIREYMVSAFPISLTTGRRNVWNLLGNVYRKAKSNLLIMGEGADLSDNEVSKDFSYLKDTIKDLLKKKRMITRIQTADTWVEWFKFLMELKKAYPHNFDLYFTNERLKFVPQLNLVNGNELVLMPPEGSVDVPCAMHIRASNQDAISAINAHNMHFKEALGFSYRFAEVDYTKHLIRCLEAVKTVQTKFLIICRFQTLRKSGQKEFEPELHRAIQRNITLDKKIYDKIRPDTYGINYVDFYSRKCKKLLEALDVVDHELCSNKRGNEACDNLEIANRITQQIPDGQNVMDPHLIAAYLNSEHIRSSALKIIEYLADCFFYIIRNSHVK